VKRGLVGDQGFPHAFHRSQVRILHGLSLGVHRLIGVTVVTGAGMTAAAHRASRFAT